MLRGSKVQVSQRVVPTHLRGRLGIVVEKSRHLGYVGVLGKWAEPDDGLYSITYFSVTDLHVIEGPVELAFMINPDVLAKAVWETDPANMPWEQIDPALKKKPRKQVVRILERIWRSSL